MILNLSRIAELLHVLMLPDFERADRIGGFWGRPDAAPDPPPLADRCPGISRSNGVPIWDLDPAAGLALHQAGVFAHRRCSISDNARGTGRVRTCGNVFEISRRSESARRTQAPGRSPTRWLRQPRP
jgi:hypothetical protein